MLELIEKLGPAVGLMLVLSFFFADWKTTAVLAAFIVACLAIVVFGGII